MYIKFDDLEMIEFFENNPINVGEDGEGILIYSIKDKEHLSMALTLDIYAKTADISVLYDNNVIFSGEFDNVIEIKKVEKTLVFCLEDEGRVILKKDCCLGVVIEKGYA